jgi:hypothetical protein
MDTRLTTPRTRSGNLQRTCSTTFASSNRCCVLGEVLGDRPDIADAEADNIADAEAEGGELVGEETACRERERPKRLREKGRTFTHNSHTRTW